MFLTVHVYISINAIKEIVARCPLSMSEDLLQDLTEYRSHKDKSTALLY